MAIDEKILAQQIDILKAYKVNTAKQEGLVEELKNTLDVYKLISKTEGKTYTLQINDLSISLTNLDIVSIKNALLKELDNQYNRIVNKLFGSL